MTVIQTLKRHSFFWFATFAAMTIVALVGMILINDSDLRHSIDGLIENHEVALSIWRFSVYLLLIYCWPKMAAFVSKSKNTDKNSRLSIILLILLYEFVIVQNPLAWVSGLLG